MSPRDFRAKHAANPAICCDDCPGWCLSESGDGLSRIERCDECWLGYDNAITDDDAAALPEAQWLAQSSSLELAS